MDFPEDDLLDGLEGKEREGRKRLLEELHEKGFSEAELTAAVQEDRLALLPVERVLGSTYTAAEIEERAGLPAERLLELRRMLGLPDNGAEARQFGEEDIAMAKSARLFLDAGLREGAVAEMTRVLGESMSRLAATTASAFVESFMQPGDTEYELATRFAELAEKLAPAVHPILVSGYNAHLRDAVRRGVIGRAEREAGAIADAQELAVCFADLVGFTRMGVQLEAEELGGVAGKLSELATKLTEPPVRLIKTIGDAAMFVSPDAAVLVGVALGLVEAVGEADLPSLRAGIAFGPALLRAGDYYGHTVNVASRVTGIARPDSVLATQAVRDAAADDYEWSFAGKHRLKGISEALALHRARRRDAQTEQDGAREKKRGKKKAAT